ncbi:hypothetical protein Bca101_030751 [Brassica carinata]
MSSSKMEASPVRLLLRARNLLTPTLVSDHTIIARWMVMSSLESIANFYRYGCADYISPSYSSPSMLPRSYVSASEIPVI